MRITTSIKAVNKFGYILSSVIGQMSDGIWENTRSMERYWKSLDFYVSADGFIVIEDKYGVTSDPCEFFANKIKQIIKIEIEDGNDRLVWNRSCGASPSYMHGHGEVTVGDCYELYELLKGRATSGKSYASYSTYTVTLTFDGVSFDVTVDALSESSAKDAAINKFVKNIRTSVKPA